MRGIIASLLPFNGTLHIGRLSMGLQVGFPHGRCSSKPVGRDPQVATEQAGALAR